jgi:hypothetical protein
MSSTGKWPVLAASPRTVRIGRPASRGLLVTYQVFINEELLLTTAAACGVIVLVQAHQDRTMARRGGPNFLRAIGVTAALATLLCAYPLWFQFNGPRSFRGLRVFHSWGEDPVTYLTMPRDTLGGSPSAETTVGLIEQNTWFGWPLVILMLGFIIALWRRSPVVRTAAVVAAGFGLAALGPHLRFNGQVTAIPGPWALVPDNLPVLGLLMPSRLTFAVIGVFTVVLAVGWDAFGDRISISLPPRTVLIRLAVATALVPLIPTPLPAQDVVRPPQFITTGAWRAYAIEGRTLIPAPVPDSGGGLHTLAWSAWAQHDFAVPGGYFLGPGPRGEGQMGPTVVRPTSALIAATIDSGSTPTVTDKMRADARADVLAWRGTAVVLRAEADREPLLALLNQLFGPGERVLDVWVWRV